MAQHIQGNCDPLADNLFLTNLGNSQAGTLWEIRVAKRQHWTLGLRAASLAIYSVQSALSAHQSGERTIARKTAIAQADLKALKKSRILWQHIPFVGVRLQSRIEEIEDELLAQLKALPKIQLLVRDSEMELAAAIAERDSIIQEHPEALELSYLELQTKYSREALMGKLAYFMASRVWASANNLPESVGQLVFEGDDCDRLEILVKELQIRHAALPTLQAAEIARKLTLVSQDNLEKLAISLGISSKDLECDRDTLLLNISQKVAQMPAIRQASLFTYVTDLGEGSYERSDRVLNSGDISRP